MNMKLLLVVALLGGLPLLTRAAEAPKAEPKITVEQRAKFWRAQAESIAAQAQMQKANAAMQVVQAEMAKACSDRPLVADQAGEPMCGEKAKPAEVKPEVKK